MLTRETVMKLEDAKQNISFKTYYSCLQIKWEKKKKKREVNNHSSKLQDQDKNCSMYQIHHFSFHKSFFQSTLQRAKLPSH